MGHAIVEWVLCVPALIALVALLFGVLFLELEQVQLEELGAGAADALARSDDNVSPFEQQAADFVRAHAGFPVSIGLDRHVVNEKMIAGPEVRPPIEIIGLELTRAPLPIVDLRLRAYARAARVR